MNEFAKLVIDQLRRGIGQGLAAGLIAAGLIFWIYRRKYRGQKTFPWKKAILTVLLVGYLGILGYATLSRLGGIGASGVNFHLFRSWRDAWNHFTFTAWANVLLNIAMLIPFGILLPLLFSRFRKFVPMLLAALALTLYIESAQYLSGRGIWDIDDVFTNTLGTMMGWCLLKCVLSAVDRQLSGFFRYALSAVLPVAVIIGIFVSYRLQEYGNLPEDRLYRQNTAHTQWTLACSLPDSGQTVDIYRLNVPTRADCDALRDHFQDVLGEDFERTDYYDTSIIYMNQWYEGTCAHFLTVRRADGCYTLSFVYENEPTPGETDRETIERCLSAYGISVPRTAEFSYLHSGIHRFTVNASEADGTRIQGSVSCTYHTDGSLGEINYELTHLRFHDRELTISPQAAYDKMCRGLFAEDSGVWKNVKTASVQSWTLDYRLDTKGFLQPVYLFSVQTDAADEALTILIPALP